MSFNPKFDKVRRGNIFSDYEEQFEEEYFDFDDEERQIKFYSPHIQIAKEMKRARQANYSNSARKKKAKSNPMPKSKSNKRNKKKSAR